MNNCNIIITNYTETYPIHINDVSNVAVYDIDTGYTKEQILTMGDFNEIFEVSSKNKSIIQVKGCDKFVECIIEDGIFIARPVRNNG